MPMQNTTARRGRAREAGFTLTELLIALVVTLLVSGAVFGLLADSNSAFRREPELSERQQNVRAAMDMILRDVAGAGVDVDPWMQMFTRADGSNQTGMLLDGQGPIGPSGAASDHLQIFGNTGSCPPISIHNITGVTVRLNAVLPDCYKPLPGVVAFSWPAGGTQNSQGEGQGGQNSSWPAGHSVAFACDQPGGGGAPEKINFPPGQGGGLNWPGGGQLPPGTPASIAPMRVLRYQIVQGADGVPELQRSRTGLYGTTGNCGGAGPAGGGGTFPWETIARGIEDLQVVYTMADGTQADSPDIVVRDDYTTLAREVRVTLVGRVMKARLQGETGGATGQFVRASLTSTVAPRAVLATLRDAPAPYTWR